MTSLAVFLWGPQAVGWKDGGDSYGSIDTGACEGVAADPFSGKPPALARTFPLTRAPQEFSMSGNSLSCFYRKCQKLFFLHLVSHPASLRPRPLARRAEAAHVITIWNSCRVTSKLKRVMNAYSASVRGMVLLRDEPETQVRQSARSRPPLSASCVQESGRNRGLSRDHCRERRYPSGRRAGPAGSATSCQRSDPG
jgi:hypothetical protein